MVPDPHTYCPFGVKLSFVFGSNIEVLSVWGQLINKIKACKPPRNDLKNVSVIEIRG